VGGAAEDLFIARGKQLIKQLERVPPGSPFEDAILQELRQIQNRVSTRNDDIIAALARETLDEDFPEYRKLIARQERIGKELDTNPNLSDEARAALANEQDEITFQTNDILDVAEARAAMRSGVQAPAPRQSPDMVPPPEPSPTATGLLEDALATAQASGDDIAVAELQREIGNLQGSVPLIAQEAERAGLGPVTPVSRSTAPRILDSTVGLPKTGGRLITEEGLPPIKTPFGRRSAEPPKFEVSPSGKTQSERLANLGAFVEGDVGVTPKKNIALQVQNLRAPGKGKQTKRALDEAAAAMNAQVQRAQGELLPSGLRTANVDVAKGQAVPVPGEGAFRRVHFTPEENKFLRDELVQLQQMSRRAAEGRIGRVENPRLQSVLLDLFKGGQFEGQFIQSTQQAEGFNRLIDNIFEKFKAGKDPTTRATGGPVA
jgi:hypothetical protein